VRSTHCSHSCRAVCVTVKSGSANTTHTPRGRFQTKSTIPCLCMRIGSQTHHLIVTHGGSRVIRCIFKRCPTTLPRGTHVPCEDHGCHSELCVIWTTILLVILGWQQGMTLHTLKKDHSKSKVLGCMTTRHFNSCRYDMLMRVMGERTVALHAPKRSDIEAKWSTYNQYTLEERVKMGRCGAESNLSKVTRHFSLLLVGKLTCSFRHSGYIFFGWGSNCQI